MEVKLKECKRKGCTKKFKQYNSLDRYCSFDCLKKDKPIKPIRRVSKKMVSDLTKYSEIREQFWKDPKNKRCSVYPEQKANQIHHKKGRKGYADKWARDRGIKLLYDIRFFLAVSTDGHREIEANPKWAYENGYSLSRTENLDQ